MEQHIFNAQTDVEIGDQVAYRLNDKAKPIPAEIYDIRLIYYARMSKQIIWEFHLIRRWKEDVTDYGWVTRDRFDYPVI